MGSLVHTEGEEQVYPDTVWESAARPLCQGSETGSSSRKGKEPAEQEQGHSPSVSKHEAFFCRPVVRQGPELEDGLQTVTQRATWWVHTSSDTLAPLRLSANEAYNLPSVSFKFSHQPDRT